MADNLQGHLSYFMSEMSVLYFSSLSVILCQNLDFEQLAIRGNINVKRSLLNVIKSPSSSTKQQMMNATLLSGHLSGMAFVHAVVSS